MWKDADPASADMLVLPGGQPGVTYLAQNKELAELLLDFNKKGKKIAAICAAPIILGALGILKGRKATCYPGLEDRLIGARVEQDKKVITDGNITTSRGVGTSITFSLHLISILEGDEKAEQVRRGIVFNHN